MIIKKNYKLYNQDCIQGIKEKIPNSSIDLIITSPPYKEEDGFSYTLINNLAKECYRILKNHSLCYINFGHLAHWKSRPFRVALFFEKMGFKWKDTITWEKNHYTPLQGNKRLNNVTEFIFQFAKGNKYKLDRLSIGIPYKDKSNIGRYSDEDLRCGGNHWRIPYETITNEAQKSHKDRFPVELPKRCILLSNLKEGDTVLDPLAGSMTTGIACLESGMKFIGFEIDKDVFVKGKDRLEKILL